MTRLIRRIAFLLAVAVPTLNAQAAAAPEPARKPTLDAELTEHFKGITLTDAQVRQVTEIKARRHAEMERIRKNAANPDEPAVRAAIQKQMDAEHADFMALLTPEQKHVFEHNMREHHAAEATRKPEMDHGAMRPGPSKAPETKKP